MLRPCTLFMRLLIALFLAGLAATRVAAQSAPDMTSGIEGLPDASVIDAPASQTAFECLLEPHKVVNISSSVPGIIARLGLDRGDSVKQGQVLVRLESGVEQAALELAKTRVEFGERQSSRSDQLYEEKFISQHEKDEMATNTQLAKLELREARERLKLRTVRSPIDGIVVDRYHSPGEFVDDKMILTVAQIDPLNVEVIVPMSMYGVVERGMKARVRPEAPVGGEYMATVTIVDRVIDAASGTIGVRLELPNPKNKIPAGLKCRIEFETDQS